MEVSAIVSAVGALNAAKNIAESMITLRDAAAFKAKLLEFQSKLLDANSAVFSAQDERSALLERIGELEKELARFERWEAEKQRYELKETPGGGFAYSLKPEAQPPEPPHQICANCYQGGKKSILQLEAPNSVRQNFGTPQMLVCPECESKVLP